VPVRLTFIDDQGREWLVRDGVVQEKRFVRIHLGDHYARFRVFDLKEPRIRKVYPVRVGESHGANGPALEVQFLNARTVERSERE
jgi:hypothetical protein